MTTTIRMARGGAKKRPYYRIVVADSRKSRNGAFIEKIGHYNPLLAKNSDQRLVVDGDRVKYWLSTGAQASDTLSRLFVKKGIDHPTLKKINAHQADSVKKKQVINKRKADAAAKLEAKKAALELKKAAATAAPAAEAAPAPAAEPAPAPAETAAAPAAETPAS